MARCGRAGHDTQIARAWLERAEGRHYADALSDVSALGVAIGLFELQARSLQEAFAADLTASDLIRQPRAPERQRVVH